MWQGTQEGGDTHVRMHAHAHTHTWEVARVYLNVLYVQTCNTKGKIEID